MSAICGARERGGRRRRSGGVGPRRRLGHGRRARAADRSRAVARLQRGAPPIAPSIALGPIPAPGAWCCRSPQRSRPCAVRGGRLRRSAALPLLPLQRGDHGQLHAGRRPAVTGREAGRPTASPRPRLPPHGRGVRAIADWFHRVEPARTGPHVIGARIAARGVLPFAYGALRPSSRASPVSSATSRFGRWPVPPSRSSVWPCSSTPG